MRSKLPVPIHLPSDSASAARLEAESFWPPRPSGGIRQKECHKENEMNQRRNKILLNIQYNIYIHVSTNIIIQICILILPLFSSMIEGKERVFGSSAKSETYEFMSYEDLPIRVSDKDMSSYSINCDC